MNWNQGLSLRAECKDCGDTGDLSYSWDLFVVNATEWGSEEGAGECRSTSSLTLLLHRSRELVSGAVQAMVSQSLPQRRGPRAARRRVGADPVR